MERGLHLQERCCVEEVRNKMSATNLFVLHRRAVTAVAFTILMSCLAACAAPIYSDIHNERFQSASIHVKRVAVIAYPDKKSGRHVGKILSNSLVNQLDKRGVEAVGGMPAAMPFSLSAEVGRLTAQAGAPDAVILIRFGKAYSTEQINQVGILLERKEVWSISYDVLDSNENGIWRGIFQLYRPDALKSGAKSISQQVITNLLNSKALTLVSSKGGR